MNQVSQVSLMHQHTNSKERLSSSVLTKMNFSKPGTKMNFQNSNKSLLVSGRTLAAAVIALAFMGVLDKCVLQGKVRTTDTPTYENLMSGVIVPLILPLS